MSVVAAVPWLSLTLLFLSRFARLRDQSATKLSETVSLFHCGASSNKVAQDNDPSLLERFGESGATHDSQSASRSGVEACVAQNLNG